MGDHPVEGRRFQSIENQVCPTSKTGAPVAPEMGYALVPYATDAPKTIDPKATEPTLPHHTHPTHFTPTVLKPYTLHNFDIKYFDAGKQPGVENNKALQKDVAHANKCYDTLASHFEEGVGILI